MVKFIEGSKGINANEHAYLKKMFEMLKVGTELEMEFEEHLEYSSVRSNLKMQSDFSVFGIGTDGVADIKGDGSLTRGVEIVTNGRMLTDVALFHAQYKKIFSKVDEQEERLISPRTGLHQHFVLQTSGATRSNLEIPLNPLFFKNFIITFKNHLAGLFWLTSALYYNEDNVESYTRYDGFHKWKHLFRKDFNISTTNAGEILDLVSTSERYNSLNIRPMDVGSNGFNNFHVEFRLSDGAVCPAQVAIQNFMFDALIKYSLEMSLFGELEDEQKRNTISINALSNYKNNPTGYDYPSGEDRYSIMKDGIDIPYFKARAHELVDVLKPFLDERVYGALSYLASYNISEMIKDELDIEDIEYMLSSFITLPKGNFDESILKLIATKQIDMTTLNRAVIDGSRAGIDVEELTNIYQYIKKNNIKI